MRALWYSIAAFVAASVFFVAFAHIDIAVANLFYNRQTGFWAAKMPLLQFLRDAGQWLVGLVAMACVALLVPKRTRMHAFLALLTFAGGVGVIVNGVFKDYWGRARPVQLAMFGGSKEFTPAWHMAQQCVSNCSFISGESAAAFWLLTPVLLLCPPRYKTLAIIGVIVWGMGMALLRMMFGGHFLSDVTLAALLLVVLALWARLINAHYNTPHRHAP